MSIFYHRSESKFLRGKTIYRFKVSIPLVALRVNKSQIVKISSEISTIDCITENQIIKIILHRIISAVWLTNFLSEIRSLINPRWWGEHLVLSVKRCSCPVLCRYRTHWWSLASRLVLGAEGGAAVWVVQDVLLLGFIPLPDMIEHFNVEGDWTGAHCLVLNSRVENKHCKSTIQMSPVW